MVKKVVIVIEHLKIKYEDMIVNGSNRTCKG